MTTALETLYDHLARDISFKVFGESDCHVTCNDARGFWVQYPGKVPREMTVEEIRSLCKELMKVALPSAAPGR